MVVDETDGVAVVELEVVREGGTIGTIVVAWEIEGDHSEEEFTPVSGEVAPLML